MKEFHDFLSRGKFRVPICNNCDKKIWPPSNICTNCYSKNIRMSKLDPRGQLIEYSESFIGKNKNLGLVEMSGIRIIGILSEARVSPGSDVKLIKCGLDKDNSPYYEFSSS
ncbi:MAG TPA: zinc ribbon domain-containing protein [Nitrososphaeraceae archaeon]|nr:zinc ribbon domain-containing protein [Nitrososphaeraceae archaeon]